MNIVRANTSRMTYHKERRVLVAEASELGIRPGPFPKEVLVQSHHRPGNVVRFVYDEDLAMRNEFWDGMEAHYKSTEPRTNAEYLVIIND
jgi:hypothetical protein